MEPRARAGKNVGKMNFSHNELAQLLYSHGDTRNPLPETIRVLDEIATEFIQGAAFEAAGNASYAGRQKVKWEDFEFAFRKNPAFLGKVQEVFQKKNEIDTAKKLFNKDDETAVMKDAAGEEELKGKEGEEQGANAGAGAGAGGAAANTDADGANSASASASKVAQDAVEEEPLGEADDDLDDAVSEAVSRQGKS